MSAQNPGLIDLARLRQRFDEDEALLQEIYAVFRSETPGRRAGIESALAADDLPKLAGMAHSLKGVSATLFAEPLRQAAHNLELSARSGDASAVRAVAPEVLDLLERTVACLP